MKLLTDRSLGFCYDPKLTRAIKIALLVRYGCIPEKFCKDEMFDMASTIESGVKAHVLVNFISSDREPIFFEDIDFIECSDGSSYPIGYLVVYADNKVTRFPLDSIYYEIYVDLGM